MLKIESCTVLCSPIHTRQLRQQCDQTCDLRRAELVAGGPGHAEHAQEQDPCPPCGSGHDERSWFINEAPPAKLIRPLPKRSSMMFAYQGEHLLVMELQAFDSA